MSGEGFKINPDELHSGADQLGQFSDHITTSLGKLRDTHQRLSTSASSDRSGVGQVLVKAATTSEKVMGDVAQEGARVAKGASDRLHTGAKSHTDNEEKQTGILKSISDKGEEGTTKPGSSSGGSGESGGGKSGGGGEPFSEPKGPSGEGAEPPLSGKKPPSASGEASTQFTEDPKLPKPSPYREPLPAADSDVRVPPADKTRGTKVEQLDEKRVTRGDDGLIKTVDGKPVKQYIGEKSAERAQGLSHNPATGQVAKKSKQAAEGRCSALAIDRRTGLVTQGVNGKATDVIPPDKLHPLLQQNLQDMRAYKHPVRGAVDKDGTPLVHDGKAHYSSPAGHAEVKASNELLWQRQAALKPGEELPASTLDDLRIDPRWTQPTGGAPIGGAAPACANCNSILDGVGSYTGRCTYDSHDGRYLNPAVPPVEE